MPSRSSRKTRAILPLLGLLAVIFSGCDGGGTPETPAAKTTALRPPGCQGCHPAMQLDRAHALACSQCHGGDDTAAEQTKAHAGLIAQPAHPEHMEKSCGPCHAGEVAAVASSLHFTLKNAVNATRAAFGARETLASLQAIPVQELPATPLALVDDLLRRRCLACHVYSDGDTYPETVRGTGCAACHLPYGAGRMQGHAFVRAPADRQCLHCHYGNRVGADYHGRYEQDFNWEYRTPYRTGNDHPRPYGVEFHQLTPDIHQQAGMACIDCHGRAQLMGQHRGKKTPGAASITCQDCHALKPGLAPALKSLRWEGGKLLLTTRLSGRQLFVPRMSHPAHRKYADTAHCSVCHSQWSFNDQAAHLIRYDVLNALPWDLLTVQGSFEAEEQLESGLSRPPFMRDKISGISRPGLWLKGYGQRRWEEIPVGLGPDSRLHVLRPILDLHLSLVNHQGKTLFAGVGPPRKTDRYRAYVPHTTGKAGAFYQERLKITLPLESEK